ncbi:MAG: hypothetical protein NC078_07250 [Ruminococcus sp.]|nr:hypothetical protein [Ruminococcus sp.]
MKNEIFGLWYEFDEWAEEFDRSSESADVHFTVKGGGRWCASFFTYGFLEKYAEKCRVTGECLGGKYFLADRPVFIERLDRELIAEVLADIVGGFGENSDFTEFMESFFTYVGDDEWGE